MTKYLLLLLPLLGFSSAIKVEHAQLQPLGKMIQTNAQITQLSDQQQEIVSRLSGHLEEYYIKPGQHVKSGDKVVLIVSIELSKMTAEYLALIEQLKAVSDQKDTTMRLHKKGLSSQNDVSNAIIALEDIRAKQNALTSQLKSLGIKPTELKEATDQFILYAHDDGVVGRTLVPLHSNVDAQTALVTLVNQDEYFAIAYLSVKDAMRVSKETKGWIDIAGKSYLSTFIQLLPNIDHETQRAKVLFEIHKSPSNLLLGAFVQMDISLAPVRKVVMVKKSALTLFKDEWVVFVEKEHNEASHHDEKSEPKKEEVHRYDDLDDEEENGHEHHETEAQDAEKHEHEEHAHEEHEGHDEHDGDEEESPYEAKAVQIIAYVGEYVAIEGLKVEEEYVSNGVYFVKSMILKSSLGGHGH